MVHGYPPGLLVRDGGPVYVALPLPTVPRVSLPLEDSERHPDGVVAVLIVQRSCDIDRARFVHGEERVHDLAFSAGQLGKRWLAHSGTPEGLRMISNGEDKLRAGVPNVKTFFRSVAQGDP